MPRDGAVIFRHLVGQLDVLNVERGRGRCRLDHLIGRDGIDDEITADWAATRDASASRPALLDAEGICL